MELFKSGASFFAPPVQPRCLQSVAANTIGVPVPDDAVACLQTALQSHWDGARYVSVLPAPDRYDPNIDIVAAPIYEAVPITDTRLLATAAQVRGQWADGGSELFDPINGTDDQRTRVRCSVAIRATPTTATPPIPPCAATPGRCARPAWPSSTTASGPVRGERLPDSGGAREAFHPMFVARSGGGRGHGGARWVRRRSLS